MVEQLQVDRSRQNLQHLIQLDGLLDRETLHRCLAEIVQRHEALRTSFPAIAGRPVQAIAPSLTVDLPLVDLSDIPTKEQVQAVQQYALSQANTPFELAQPPLWRFQLIRLSPTKYMLLRTVHHIIFDAWSHSVFMRELGSLYPAFLQQQPSPLAPLAVQYVDYVVAQRQWLQGEVRDRQLRYWQTQLTQPSGASNYGVAGLQLPIDQSDGDRPTLGATHTGDCHSLVLPQPLVQNLRRFSYQQGVSLFVTLLTGFQALLHGYTQQEDMVICSPVLGRHRAESKTMIGYFNTIVPLRTDLSGNPTVGELLQRVSQVATEAYEHQDTPVQWLSELPDLAHLALSRALFTLHNAPNPVLNLPHLQVQSHYVFRDVADFHLALSVQDQANELTVFVQYKTGLFSQAAITQFLEHFQRILANLVADPDQSLAALVAIVPPAVRPPREATDDTHTAAVPVPTAVAEPASSELAAQLASVWAKTLGLPRVGIHDNFFALGGNSLLAIRLVHEIETTLGCTLPLSSLVNLSTIAAMIQAWDQAIAPTTSQPPAPPADPSDRPDVPQLHPEDLRGLIVSLANWPDTRVGARQLVLSLTANATVNPNVTDARDRTPTSPPTADPPPPLFFVGYKRLLVEYVSLQRPMYILPAGILPQQPESYIQALASCYVEEIRSIQPHGPYVLSGYCFGALVALEMAHQLHAQGETVEHLVLIDIVPADPVYQRYRRLMVTLCRLTYHHIPQTLRHGVRRIYQGGKRRFRQLLTVLPLVPMRWRLGAVAAIADTAVRTQPAKDPHRVAQQQLEQAERAKLWAALNVAIQSYPLRPYPGKTTVIVAGDFVSSAIKFPNTAVAHDPLCFPRAGWGKFLTGELRLELTPGDHATFLEEPHVRVLAKKLCACLDTARV